MFHPSLAIACFLLLAFALSGLARQVIVINGELVEVEGVEIECHEPKCCLKALKELLKDVEWIFGTPYVTKHDHNSVKTSVTCPAFIVKK